MANSIRKESATSSRPTVVDFEAANLDYHKYLSTKKWEWSYLRQECENLGLDVFYRTYIHRMQRSFLSIILVIQFFVSVSHILLLVYPNNNNATVIPDIFLYSFGLLIFMIVLLPAFNEDISNTWRPFVCSFLATLVQVGTDLVIPTYHAVITEFRPPLRPMYASHNLLIIYIFLPIADNFTVLIMGLTTTVCYTIVMIFVSYALDKNMAIKVLSEVMFLVCINFMGMFFRLTNEIDIRRTFLDRRECVQRNLSLKFEQNQEKELLLSILPEHIAEKMEKDIKSMIEKKKQLKRTHSMIADPQNIEMMMKSPLSKRQWSATNKLYAEKHSDVSILYADVVNFTQMTTQLPVRTLVETLHELFVKFDEASVEHNVLRIKFLGDCYYCVSGVPIKTKRHAKNCVDLGLRMIKDIRVVRIARNLNIDMRIGIHSGSIIGGVMGKIKWQFECWSKDVIIANKIESTGISGKVHISYNTLELLNGEYHYEEGTEAAKTEPILVKNNIQTFLISPKNNRHNDTQSSVDKNVYRRPILQQSISYNDRRPTQKNFMQNSMEQFRDIMKQTNNEMERELERMPIGKFQLNKLFTYRKVLPEPRRTFYGSDSCVELEEYCYQAKKTNKISTILLRFETSKWEWSFLNQPDQLLKYSVLMSFVVLIAIAAIQFLNRSIGIVFYVCTFVSIVVMFTFIPILWFKKLWDYFKPVYETDPSLTVPPRNKYLRKLYEFSYDVMSNAVWRTLIYLMIVIILAIVSLLHLVECGAELIDGPFGHFNITKSSANETTHIIFSSCLNSWYFSFCGQIIGHVIAQFNFSDGFFLSISAYHLSSSVTQCLVLSVCTTFLFLRIHFVLKLLVAVIIDAVYYFIIFHAVKFIYDTSATVNPSLDSKFAHFLKVLAATIIFHLIDRQSEYIQRVGYIWKQQLQERKETAEITKETNKILVHNILPLHVAELYLSRQFRNDFYNEEYENVSVMFATVVNFEATTDTIESEHSVLRSLNEIICTFDETLLTFSGYQMIEKIKVAGWSYMCACGLDPGRGDSTSSHKGLIDGRRSLNMKACNNLMAKANQIDEKRKHKTSVRQSNNIIIVLVEFALELMRVLKRISEENENFKDQPPLMLRVGISHGKVMAGVVGSSKPLYDIWGDSVNMASRFDSTGLPGMIQVSEETANVLMQFGICCNLRGEINVKGKGLTRTFFVAIDDKLDFVKSTDLQLTANTFETQL